MSNEASGEERWVVVKATAPHWFTLQVPRVIARVLPLRSELRRRDRRMGFLDRGPGVAQVVPIYGAPSDIAAELDSPRGLAVATFTDRLLFTLPSAVRKHLELRISRHGRGHAPGTNDLVAWMVPERDWEATSDRETPSTVRVYLTRSQFPARCDSAAGEGSSACPPENVRHLAD